MTAATFDRRRALLRALMGERSAVQRLVVTDLANVRYLTGFSGSNAVLVVGPSSESDLLGTDGRYEDQVRAESPGLPTVIDRDTLSATLREGGPAPFAVESGMPIGLVQSIREAHGDVVVLGGLVEDLRLIKDPDEIRALERAGSITVAGFAQVAGELHAGMTERSVARRLEQVFGELGAEDRAFDTIVGSGPHSAIPHHQPGERRLEPGDLVVIDAGARVDGYHADMTRTYLVGGRPESWQQRAHSLVLEAQQRAAAQYRAGTPAVRIDGVARGVIADAGEGDRFTHGLGHGVGLRIHEAPMVGPRATGTIDVDMAITVEPGLYLPGRGGVRIEDTLVVTDSGPQILTEAPRDLLVVG